MHQRIRSLFSVTVTLFFLIFVFLYAVWMIGAYPGMTHVLWYSLPWMPESILYAVPRWFYVLISCGTLLFAALCFLTHRGAFPAPPKNFAAEYFTEKGIRVYRTLKRILIGFAFTVCLFSIALPALIGFFCALTPLLGSHFYDFFVHQFTMGAADFSLDSLELAVTTANSVLHQCALFLFTYLFLTNFLHRPGGAVLFKPARTEAECARDRGRLQLAKGQ